MIKRKSGKIILGMISVAIVSVVIWQMSKTITSAKPLTEAEAGKIAQERYNGDIVEIKKDNQLYQIKLKLVTGTYLVEIDQETGDVMNLTRIQQIDQVEKPVEPTTPPDKEAPGNTVKITEEEAIQIALQKVTGVVDDVEKKQANGKTYYIVEIESENGEEAKVQVNAITGEVMTIMWDD